MKHALRQLTKTPGFTFVAILILALGIGFSASSFSVANTLLLRNLPYPDPARLVRIFGTAPDTQTGGHAPGNILDIRENATSFSGIAVYSSDNFPLGMPGEPAERAMVTLASANFFDVLGTPLLLGRGFAADEDQEGKTQVTVLSYSTWMRRFAGDPAIIGRTVRLDARSFIVIGVLPATFDAPLVWGPTEFFCPRPPYPGMRAQRGGSRWLQAFGRLKPGVNLTAAQSELTTLGQQLALAYPKDNQGRGLRLTTLHDSNLNQTTRLILWLTTALSLAMMLIACANLASLQVARALGRHKDFAVRAALGGNRWQLMRPLLAEGCLLAGAGGVLGLLVAIWSNALVGRFLDLGAGAGPGFDIPIDGRVLGFAALNALFCSVAFSLLPAWLSARASAADALKENSRGSTSGRSQHRVKSFLVVGQVAVAFVLVGIAASFGVGFKRIIERDLGWRVAGLVSGEIVLPTVNYGELAKQQVFATALRERLAAQPGFEQVALCSNVPTFYFGGGNAVFVENRPADAAGREPVAYGASVTSGYFTTMGIPLKQGADFAPNHKPTDPAVVIINESFARQFWPGTSPVGKRIRLSSDPTWFEIIGVAGDVKVAAQLTPPASRLQVYRPLLGSRYLTIVLHSSVAPEALVKTMRATVATLDADLPVSNAGSIADWLRRALANNDLIIVNFAISAGMGLLIAAIGLSGVISQLAQQRARDIGIRLALGATASHILRLILGEGVKLLAIGLTLGAAGYYGLTRVLTSQMSEIDFPGLWLLALNLVVLSVVMLAACYLPARRATKVDPLIALRAE